MDEEKDIKQTSEERIKENYEVITKKRKKIILSISISLALIIVVLLFSMIFSLINLGNSNIISKVKINGIEMGNLSREEAIQKLSEIASEKLDGEILIKADEFEYGIKLSQIETTYNIEKAVEEAYNIGRRGNIFSNNYEILGTLIDGKEINLEYTYNEELIDKLLDDIASKVPEVVTESTYSIEEDKLIITPGKSGNSIDKEKVKQEIISKILDQNTNIELHIELIKKDPEQINIDKIYEEVHTEPKDAYYTKDPFQIFPHINGVDFDLEAAREILKEEKEEYEIDLKITEPKVKTSQIGTEAFPDLLSSFTTKYDASNKPRTTNLILAMNKLNGTVVASGETFSYNKTLGKRTAEAGYKEAGGYAGGRVVQTLAGGICQISSTLYDAAVYANLEIVERKNHMFLAGYVEAGKDATVVYGSIDFKFKNTRKYPIMIKTSIGNGVARVDIYGIKEEIEYDVDIITNVLSYTPFKVIYENDSSLAEGQEKVEQKGMNGCKSITYKVLKLNGTEVSREVLSSDTYDPMNKIIKVGAKKTVETNNTPVQEIQPQPETVQEPKQVEPEPQPQTNPEPEQENNQNPEPSGEQQNNNSPSGQGEEQPESQNGGSGEQNPETNP